MSISNRDSKKFDAIVCLSAIDWDFLWQRTQEIMSQFASMGYPVLFVENTGARMPGLKDVPRVWARVSKLLSASSQVKKIPNENISVVSPLALPFPYNDLALNWNFTLLRKKILAFSEERNIPVNRMLLWSYMTTPLALELAIKLPWAAVVVDLVSDPCKIHNHQAFAKSHKLVLETADVVLCASVQVSKTARTQMKPEQHHTVQVFEDGFSTQLLNMPDTSGRDKSLFRQIKEPRIAYIGGINDKVWWEAVSAMANSFPQHNFVFAGPKDFEELPGTNVANNVFWLPPFKEYHQLGNFLNGCKAGLIPYIPTPYVAEMRPAKINEYLVMGLPIVATKMPELERLGQQYGPGIVYLAEKPEDFVEALKLALEEDCEELRTKRREIVEKRSWKRVCKELEKKLHG